MRDVKTPRPGARRLAGPLLLLLCATGCPRRGAQQPGEEAADPAVRAALSMVAEARSHEGLAPARLALPVMDDLRQVEVARGAQRRKATAEQIAEAFRGAVPDHGVSAAERGRRYAGNASLRLKQLLGGPCQGRREDLGGELRIGALTAPLPSEPPGSDEVLARLKTGLTGARMVAINCQRGSVGMLLVPKPVPGQGARPAYLIVDMVPTGLGKNAPPVPLPGGKAPGTSGT